MTQPIPPDDDPPYSDDDAPDAPPTKTKRKRRQPAQKFRVVQPDEPVTHGDDWRKTLRYKADNSGLTKDPGNAALLLAHSDDWKGCLGFDEFSRRVYWRRTAPHQPGLPAPTGELQDSDIIYVQHWLARTHGVAFTGDSVFSAINAAARANSFHPVKEYLASTPWDGVQRLPTMLKTYFGVQEAEAFAAQAGVLWMISAVARIYRPGCQADYMLILEGKQNLGKSTGLKTLFGKDWYSNSKLPIGSDEAPKKLQGKWCQEIAELDAFRGRAWNEVKSFITDATDRYRDSYGRTSQDHPRTCIFAGTTNEEEYLGDRTGNRRFWPLKCTRVDREAIARDRNLLWAEALARFESGEPWYFQDESLARAEQRKREQREPWYEIIVQWLERPTCPEPDGSRRLIDMSQGFTQAELLSGALSLRSSDMTPQAQQRAGFVLSRLGYKRARRREGLARVYRYFPQNFDTGPDEA